MARSSSGSLILMLIVGAVLGILGSRLDLVGPDDDSHMVDWNLDVKDPKDIQVCAYTKWIFWRYSCKVNLHISNAPPNAQVEIRTTRKERETSDQVFEEFDGSGSYVIQVDGDGTKNVPLTVNRHALFKKENGHWNYGVSTTTLLSKIPRDQPEIIIEN